MQVIFLHGFGETSDVWSTFTPLLPPDNEYITLDYSGITFCQTIEEYADWLHTEVLQRDIRLFALIGHSMGGYISMAYAKKHPEYLSGLGLFHSTTYADSEEKKKVRNKTAEFIGKHGTDTFIEDFLPQMYYPDFLRKNASYINKHLIDNKQIPKEALQTATIAMRDREDTHTVLERLKIPVMMIIGKADKFVPYQDSLAQIGLCQHPYVLILDNSAHAAMHEAPQVCAALTSEFLTACDK